MFGQAFPAAAHALFLANAAPTPSLPVYDVSPRLASRGLYSLNKLNDHHELPQQYRPNFRRAGMMNIDDPQYMRSVPRYLQEDIHSGLYTGGVKYNDMWRDFFRKNPEAQEPEILEFLELLRLKMPW
jgi:hypothetical protein